MNVIGHNHITSERRTKFTHPAPGISFECSLRFRQITNPQPVAGAKCHEVNRLVWINFVKTPGAAFEPFLRLTAIATPSESPATTTGGFFCGGTRPRPQLLFPH